MDTTTGAASLASAPSAIVGLGNGRPAYPEDGDAAFRAGPHPSCAASIAAARLPAEVKLLTRHAARR
jgi:hypothetical protein